MEKVMTLRAAAKAALAVQDACNLSGVARSFSEILSGALWPEARSIGEGTRWVNTHPIATLFLSKMADLNGFRDRYEQLAEAFEKVEAMAEPTITIILEGPK